MKLGGMHTEELIEERCFVGMQASDAVRVLDELIARHA